MTEMNTLSRLLPALWLLATVEASAATLNDAPLPDDEKFSLLCKRVKYPEVPPIVLNVDLRAGTVTGVGYHFPFTKPPESRISDREIYSREDYATGWSILIIDRYTGDGVVHTASKPDATISDGPPSTIHCTKTAGKLF